MIVVADSGSTKTEWSLIENGKICGHQLTSGINPFYQNTDEIAAELRKEWSEGVLPLSAHIFYYGTGCANPEKNAVVAKALELFFGTSSIEINSDLVGAARSLCQNTEGIACILGTGSNSCYYDGKNITGNISPLGYMLGDEGSGAVMGKKLISDILKHQLPDDIIDLFFSDNKITPDQIMESVYRKPFPNRYLARFTRFLYQYIDKPEIEKIVLQSFDEFIVRNVLQYKQAGMVHIHFTGSIAWHFKPQLKRVLNKHNLHLGNVTQAPMEDLVKYHIRNL